LADCLLRLGNAGYEPYLESIAKAKIPLKRALDCDPNLAEAHATLSLMLFNEDDLLGAEDEARRAIELNPSLPEAYNSLSNVTASKGEADETVRLIETYYRLDPIRPRYVVDLGIAYWYAGRESEALEHWRKAVELAPVGTYMVMAEYYVWKGDFEKAKQLHSTVEKLDPNNFWVSWMRGFIAAQTGDRNLALLAIRKIEESKVGALGLTGMGFIYYALGDLDSYFDYMNRALELHAVDLIHVMYCPLFAKGRVDLRYQAMMEKAKKMWLV
jgi:tetratricopeptide (TPR) repeat protein